jgi:Na+/melibiose symporter-like transporter
MKERAINPIAQIMLRQAAAPDWLVGLLVGSVPAAIGMFLSPFASVKSDRHRGRWGRRIPFILFPTPLIVLMMVGLAFSPEIGNWAQRALGFGVRSQPMCRIAVFGLFWTLLEIATIIVNSIVNALVNDVVPQGLIGRFYGLFRFVSLFAGILFNYYLIGKVDAHYRVLLLVLAGIYGIGFIMMGLRVREGTYPPPPPMSDHSHGRLSAVVSFFRESFTHPFYLWFFAANTLANLAIAPINTYSIFHARSVGMSDGTYGKCIALSYACSLVLAYPLGALADKIHPLRMGIIFITLYGMGTTYGFFYGTTAPRFFIAMFLHTVISGCFFTGTSSIGQRLLPRSKFGEISAAGGIVGAVAGMFLPPALGLFIKEMNHDYRYAFLLGSILTVAAVVCYAVVLHMFKQLGGDEHYCAPEETEPCASDPPAH